MAAVIYIAVVDTIFRFLSECDVKSGSMVGVDVARKAALLNNVRCLCDVVLGAEAEKALDSCNNESASPRDFTHNSIDRLAACESDMSFTCFSTRDGHDADGCVETTSLLRQSSTEGSTVDRTELNKSSTAQNCAVTGLSVQIMMNWQLEIVTWLLRRHKRADLPNQTASVWPSATLMQNTLLP